MQFSIYAMTPEQSSFETPDHQLGENKDSCRVIVEVCFEISTSNHHVRWRFLFQSRSVQFPLVLNVVWPLCWALNATEPVSEFISSFPKLQLNHFNRLNQWHISAAGFGEMLEGSDKLWSQTTMPVYAFLLFWRKNLTLSR